MSCKVSGLWGSLKCLADSRRLLLLGAVVIVYVTAVSRRDAALSFSSAFAPTVCPVLFRRSLFGASDNYLPEARGGSG